MGKRIKELTPATTVLGTNMIASDPASGGSVYLTLAQLTQYILQFAMRSIIELPANTDFDLIRIGQVVGGYTITHGQGYSVEINDDAVSQSKKIKNDWNQSAVWGNGIYTINCYGISSNMVQTVKNLATSQVAERAYSGSSWMNMTVGGISNIYWWVDNEIYASDLTGTGYYSGWFRKNKTGRVQQGGLSQTPGTIATVAIKVPIECSFMEIVASVMGNNSSGSGNDTCYSMIINTTTAHITHDYSGVSTSTYHTWVINGTAA